VNGVVVTGSNGGIGGAIVQLLRKTGYFVIGVGRSPDQGKSDAYIRCDLEEFVVDEALRQNLAREAERLLDGRKLTALINNSAIQILSRVPAMSLGDFTATMNVNVIAAFALSQALFPFLEASHGSIVNIGSIHAKLTKPGFVAYATSKAALRGLTQAMAVECGASIRVNMIEPAAISTGMLLEGFAESPEEFKNLNACHPTGRIGQPGEIAETVAFLISDKCTFMNGSIIEVHGGIGARLHDPV
jgi:NAD(P)-dependent dehydrogenase (short-subunit alcohol dehydrogenase family)